MNLRRLSRRLFLRRGAAAAGAAAALAAGLPIAQEVTAPAAKLTLIADAPPQAIATGAEAPTVTWESTPIYPQPFEVRRMTATVPLSRELLEDAEASEGIIRDLLLRFDEEGVARVHFTPMGGGSPYDVEEDCVHGLGYDDYCGDCELED